MDENGGQVARSSLFGGQDIVLDSSTNVYVTGGAVTTT